VNVAFSKACVGYNQISKFTKTLAPMRKFWLDAFLCTMFVFVVLYGISNLTQLGVLQVFDPISQAIGDMELTDITFSNIREDPGIDSNIVLVNIGNLSRMEVAQQIRNISMFKPKVIGIDAFYGCPTKFTDSINCPRAYDTLTNLVLASAIQEAGNVVMVTKLLQSDSLYKIHGDAAIYDSLKRSDRFITGNTAEGFASLDTDAEHQEDVKISRKVNPYMDVKNERLYAFSVLTAMAYDSAKAKRFLNRGKELEVINFRGNIYDPFSSSGYAGRYYTLDAHQALDTSTFVAALIKGKIVMMGFLGGTLSDTSWDDKFFTPLNKKFAGRANPDMYGLVVHANVVSMILNEDYVNEIPNWVEYFITFLVCLANVAVFLWINRKIPLWFDGLSILIQFVQIILLSLLMVYAFNYNWKLELTTTLLVVALVGTCFELYSNVVKTFWYKFKESMGFPEHTKRYKTR
jgi:CHASE2 domain-containing sensor protein